MKTCDNTDIVDFAGVDSICGTSWPPLGVQWLYLPWVDVYMYVGHNLFTCPAYTCCHGMGGFYGNRSSCTGKCF